ncbi:MAG: hypothetical protein QGI10_07750 [Vicinamibacterales bacterium]|jgi:hypothetical protein|nr:hypothetical protein [Vicinamibacterales bacterium]MDP7479147.1 hypothetical protein [Vicinamibacterales bacterium]HJN43168.1 hypothetical protein [Vicinamibacterales bacterium]
MSSAVTAATLAGSNSARPAKRLATTRAKIIAPPRPSAEPVISTGAAWRTIRLRTAPCEAPSAMRMPIS